MNRDKQQILAQIGREARLLRYKHGLSVKDMAAIIGCSVQNIYKFERGENDSAFILYAYIRELGGDDLEDIRSLIDELA